MRGAMVRVLIPDLNQLPMSMRLTDSCAAVCVALLLTGCAGARGSVAPAPVPNASHRVVDAGNGRTISFAAMADAAAKADVVFFGEQHDDDETHRAELALLEAIGQRRTKVVLSLEMFERDVQAVVSSYLGGTIGDSAFRAQSRPWPNYAADYRPLVELAKARGWPVVASNIPRRLASAVSRRGLVAVDSMTPSDRAFVARDLLCPRDDKYYTNFLEVMGAGHGGAAGTDARSTMDRFYEAQCAKDETMAESIVEARAAAGSGAIVVHFNGAFHSDFGLGTASRVRRRLPRAKTVVVSAVPTPTPGTADATGFLDRGQFIILALRTKP